MERMFTAAEIEDGIQRRTWGWLVDVGRIVAAEIARRIYWGDRNA